MPDDNDALIPDALERPAKEVSLVLRTLRDLALLVLAIACAVAAFYVALAARDVSRWATEARQATIEQQAVLVTQVGDILTEVRGATTDVRAATQQATGVLSDVRTTTLPRMNGAFDDLHATIDRTAPKVDAILGHVDDTVVTVNRTIEVRSDQLGGVIAELQKTSANVAIITDPSEVEPIYASIRESAADMKTSMNHVTVVTANAAEVSTYYKSRIIPRAYKPTGNPLIRGLKYSAHYTLEVLKSTPQIAIVAIQVLR